MFPAVPPLVGLLIRYYLTTEGIKFATGTKRKDWIKMSLDISEQIGDIYEARVRQGQLLGEFVENPVGVLMGEAVTGAAGVLGIPGTAAEALGFTFPGEAAKQRRRLEAEIAGGFPFTRKRIKGAPEFAKRKLSTWNREIKKAYKEVKAKKNQFGPQGKINNPKQAFAQIVKMVSKYRKGKKLGKSKAGKQITRILKRGGY